MTHTVTPLSPDLRQRIDSFMSRPEQPPVAAPPAKPRPPVTAEPETPDQRQPKD